MPTYRPRSCRYCGRSRDEVGQISWSGACAECGDRRYSENHAEMVGPPKGAFYYHWRRRTLAAFGVAADENSESNASTG